MAKTMTKAERFFWKNAGFGYDPKTETKAQGRRRAAEHYAEAERQVANLGWEYRWEDDWDIGSHAKFYGPGSVYADEGREPDTCEYCQLVNGDGKVLASLGCIDDADDKYRRVVQAELAIEALHQFEREIEAEDVH